MRRLAIALTTLALAVPAGAAGSATFVPNDPLAVRQWYLNAIHAFDFWPEDPVNALAPVRVAIIDSGIDLDHPEFAGRILNEQSFVGGDVTDRQGHGTFVAGIIAATPNNGAGIAGIAFPAQLLIAKVVRADGTIAPAAEAKAIRWAADNGARVINLSLGGLRDPLDPREDTYSAAEQSAIAYAYSKGAVVVAAVGNADEAPKTPWHYASYPAALPHVLGVSALSADGSVPMFSIRDKVYNDISAPGVGIVSTLPRALTASRSGVPRPGLLDLRAARVPAGRRDVVRRGPGHGGGRAPDRGAALAVARPGDVAARAHGRRCQRSHRLLPLPARPRLVQRLGTPRRRRRAEGARRAAPSA